MQKLRLKVKQAGHAVVMVPEQTHERYKVKKGTDKKLTEKESAKLKPQEMDCINNQIHPGCRLQFVPLKEDKTVYKTGDVFEVTLQKKTVR